MKNKLFDGMSAHCCRDFILPESIDKIKARYKEWLRCFEEGEPYKDAYGEDLHIVYPMLIYKGEFPYGSNGNKLHYNAHHYTCKHLDRTLGHCTIYDTRPSVCRKYPSYKCGYKGCSTYSICNGTIKERSISDSKEYDSYKEYYDASKDEVVESISLKKKEK